jgi:hypothetical protein
MKLWIQDIRHSCEETPRVIPSVLRAAGITLVNTQSKADYGIMYNIFGAIIEDPRTFNFSPYPLPLSRIIACYDEPPLYYHEEHYAAHNEYLAWFPMPKMGSHIPLTVDPPVFPYPPYTKYDRVREDTTLHDRAVFYRGNQRTPMPGGTQYGRIDLNQPRVDLVQGLLDAKIPMDILGRGWTATNTYNCNDGIGGGGRWPESKRKEWAVTTADFHLCCENSHLENYVTEKIHHGFQSDLVVLYLGNRQIEEYVPKDAFINLNGCYDVATNVVNSEAVVDRIRSIMQDEYDSILHTARAWRRSGLEERHEVARARLTQMVLDRFHEVGAL